MWEWVTGRDAHGGWTGVSMTCHGAMEALARGYLTDEIAVAAVVMSFP